MTERTVWFMKIWVELIQYGSCKIVELSLLGQLLYNCLFLNKCCLYSFVNIIIKGKSIVKQGTKKTK